MLHLRIKTNLVIPDNKASGPIIILGKYESEYNWKNSSETKNRLQRFHSQFYVNGTKCDLTGEPRGTEVRVSKPHAARQRVVTEGKGL